MIVTQAIATYTSYRPDNSVPLLRRLLRGAMHHLALRIGDWFMSSIVLSLGLVLLTHREMFDVHPQYIFLKQYGSVGSWGWACVTVGGARVAALFVNGTFRSFRFSPHMRFAMATLTCFLWFQITLGLIATHTPTMTLALFPNLLLFDLYNVFLAASEAGVVERRYKNAGG